MVAPDKEALLPTQQTAETQPEHLIDSAKTLQGFSQRFRSLAACILLMLPASDIAEAGEPAPISPSVPSSGTLMIAGGGRLPSAIREHFVELAGGKKAHIIIINTASDDAENPEAQPTFFWDGLQSKVESADIFHARSREMADDEELTTVLNNATGVWMSGGIQKRLVQTYYNTRTLKKIQNVLANGGVVGGTSAGAAVMSGPMIEEGEEVPVMKTGFNFLPGAVVDQHFLKRNRHKRLLLAMKNLPGHVGIGVDEATVAIVHAHILRVMGDSTVSMYRPDGELTLLKHGEERDITTFGMPPMNGELPVKIAQP